MDKQEILYKIGLFLGNLRCKAKGIMMVKITNQIIFVYKMYRV